MKNKNAFSLIELLISLIIISLIVGAFAPIMTKKLNNTLFKSKKYKELLLLHGDSKKKGLYDCKKSEDSLYTDCKFIVPQGVVEINAVLVGGGGGGGGGVNKELDDVSDDDGSMTTVFDRKVILSGNQDYSEMLDSTWKQDSIIEITPNMFDVKIDYLIGEGGINGFADVNLCNFNFINEVNKLSICPIGSLFLASECNQGSFKNLCITEKNIGDSLPLGNKIYPNATITKVKPNETCNNNNCCWGGGLYTAGECSNSTIDYSSCNRTICTFGASEELCKQYAPSGTNVGNWHLPNKIDFIGWDYNYNKIGLGFCDNSLSDIKCTDSMLCLGSYNNTCSPSSMWSDKNTANSAYYNTLSDGYFSYDSYIADNKSAYSARCVSEAPEFFIIGNGGGSGAMLKDIEIPQEVIFSNIGGVIRLHMPYASSEQRDRLQRVRELEIQMLNGTNNPADIKSILAEINALSEDSQLNASTYVEIKPDIYYDSVWGLSAAGGEFGKNTIIDPSFRETTPSSRCQVLDYGSWEWKFKDCSKISKGSKNGNPGKKGVILKKLENIPDTAAESIYDGEYEIEPGKGSNGSIYSSTRGQLSGWIGSEGDNGFIQISYKERLGGRAGSGGSGACAARIEKIKVNPGDEITIRIGAGGIGGSTAENGKNGNTTFISYLSDFHIEANGGNGGHFDGSEADETICIDSLDKLPQYMQSSSSYFKFKNNGKKGEKASADAQMLTAIGGSGGMSGFFDTPGFQYLSLGGCGGYSTGACFNGSKNGLGTNVIFPSKLYEIAGDYGTLGSGGGGGGWHYDVKYMSPAGSGGKGLDGFVYLYWKDIVR